MSRLKVTAAVAFAACLACAAPVSAAASSGRDRVRASAAPRGPALQVTGASLIAAGTNQPLWGYKQNTERAIASTTKLMTALIVLQHVKDLNTVFTQGPWVDQPGDSQIGLVPGERMSVANLMKAMLIPSADDAAEDLAYNVGGHSVSRFLEMMNAEARKLGLRFTHYTTPTGLDTPGNYSTPYELARLGGYDMRHFGFFHSAVDTTQTTIRSSNGTPYQLLTTDTLLGQVKWIDGIKTGHTDDAGYVLVSEGTQHGLTLIASVLGTSSEHARNENALRLLEWGFDTYREAVPVRAGEVFAHATVSHAGGATPASVKLVAANAYSRVVPKGARVSLSVQAPATLTAPMRKGAVVGAVTVLVNGKRIARVPLVLRTSLSSNTPVATAAATTAEDHSRASSTSTTKSAHEGDGPITLTPTLRFR